MALVVGVSMALAFRVLLCAQPETSPAAWPGARAGATLSAEDDAFLDEMERAAFRFSVEQTHPRTGLVRDRARADGSPSEGKASIAASGFALTAWAVATQRGWVERAAAVERVRLMLRFLAHEAPRQHGFYYHFMEMDTRCSRNPCRFGVLVSAYPEYDRPQAPHLSSPLNKYMRCGYWRRPAN